ncbi:unnamed protein product [Caenorhabditis brenneri]
MSRLILLFLSIPFVLSAEPKCPEDFVRVERTPTVKNNHTSDWCFAVLALDRAGSRDWARGLCANYNYTLSIPESLEEFRLISAYSKGVTAAAARDFNKTITNLLIAVDGEFTPKCKAKMVRNWRYKPKKDKGECGLHQNLFSFDDSNSDPTFALDRNLEGYPNGRSESGFPGGISIARYASCLAMDPDRYDSAEFKYEDITNHTLHDGFFHLTWCDGSEGEEQNMFGVLCGGPPQ